ncbi:unnamed protein product [Adineta steineri]|uniref:Uncharacterized protein n=1 Tax=Adineta steineri TaxID=433720 RepID=A0A819H265_9BILA|nr:unnamed protein product [Adineta steineri]CAF1455140.1 unnamed protein product [Adineta steineri]CAF3893151.1 unnamed protein product [Adineta steineri]CAF4199146.1 unnamed protein product [Adineta steineri]
MAFFCGSSKSKDDVYRNNDLDKRIKQCKQGEMDLSSMNLTDDDIQIIVDKVIKKNKCTSLSLSKNQITSDGIRILCESIKKNKNLTHLTLSSNPIGDEGIKYINDLILNSPFIVQLSLADTNLTDNGIITFTKVLTGKGLALRGIDLRSNKSITDSSVEYFLQMTDKNETLSTCRLGDCGFSQDGKDRLKDAKVIKC